MNPKIRKCLGSEFLESEFPYNTYYGDGSEIEPEVLAEIRAAYQQETVTFCWQAGDILMLDNMLTAHGRNPFVGSRQVVVGMAESINSKNNLWEWRNLLIVKITIYKLRDYKNAE